MCKTVEFLANGIGRLWKESVGSNLSLEAIDQLNVFVSFYCVMNGIYGLKGRLKRKMGAKEGYKETRSKS